ncbi:MAG: hypothetical protein LC797_06410 [Chloroflexi bacterium]|nr:hypothetical protein [Chloroflexota bacterium]
MPATLDGETLHTFDPTDEVDTISAVSDALKRKYQERWPAPLAGMLPEEVLPTTMRLESA